MNLLVEQAKIKLMLAWCDSKTIDDLYNRSDKELLTIINAYDHDRQYTYERLDSPKKCTITTIRKWLIFVRYTDL